MKNKTIIIVLLLTLLFTACSSNEVTNKTIELKQGVNTQTFRGKVAILLEDTKLLNPYTIDYKEGVISYLGEDEICNAKKNDIVVVFEEEKESSRVAVYCEKFPYLRGEIDNKLLSYDETLFKNGNQTMIKDAMGYDVINGKEIRRYSGIGIKLEEKDGWTKVKLHGEVDEVWIRDIDLCEDFKCTTLDIIDLKIFDRVK